MAEEQSLEPRPIPWLPEHAEVIDDVIEELCSMASNKKEIRELIKVSPLYPEGEGLENDIGYIQCEPSRALIVRMVHLMIDADFQFRGLIYRDKAALTTILIGFGLTMIESLLTKRKERIQKGWEDFLVKKTTYSIADYNWKALAATEKTTPFYKFNYYVLDSTISGRINKIKREYGLPRSFLAEMSILEAIRISRLFPAWVIEELDREHEEFSNWVTQKEKVDTG